MLGVLRIYWAQERSQLQWLLFNALLLPGFLCYLGFRVSGDTAADRSFWITGSVALAIGTAAIAQTAFAVIMDRFQGRLALLRSSPVGKSSYYFAHVTLAVGESIAIMIFALVGLAAAGIARPSIAGAAQALGLAALAGSAMGGVGVLIGSRAPSIQVGDGIVAVAGLGLAILSPVFYEATSLPAFVRPLTWLSPFTHAAALLRAAVGGTEPPLASLAALLVLAALAHALGYRLLKWRAA